jgi:hypothetical protein
VPSVENATWFAAFTLPPGPDIVDEYAIFQGIEVVDMKQSIINRSRVKESLVAGQDFPPRFTADVEEVGDDFRAGKRSFTMGLEAQPKPLPIHADISHQMYGTRSRQSVMPDFDPQLCRKLSEAWEGGRHNSTVVMGT